ALSTRRDYLHSTRNLAGQDLATLSNDVVYDISRRYSEFKEDGLVEGTRQCSSEVMFVTNDDKEVAYVSRAVP
ncbi:hypothetical protein CPB85DRAFT_1282444, partial [Mucidula mucida]